MSACRLGLEKLLLRQPILALNWRRRLLRSSARFGSGPSSLRCPTRPTRRRSQQETPSIGATAKHSMPQVLPLEHSHPETCPSSSLCTFPRVLHRDESFKPGHLENHCISRALAISMIVLQNCNDGINVITGECRLTISDSGVQRPHCGDRSGALILPLHLPITLSVSTARFSALPTEPAEQGGYLTKQGFVAGEQCPDFPWHGFRSGHGQSTLRGGFDVPGGSSSAGRLCAARGSPVRHPLPPPG